MPPRVRPREIAVVTLICWLGGVAWLSWRGIDPSLAAVGVGIVALFGGLTVFLVRGWRAYPFALPLVLGVIPFSNPRTWERRTTFIHVDADATFLGASLVVVSLATCLVCLGRQKAAATASDITSPMWEADADRPLAPEGPH